MDIDYSTVTASVITACISANLQFTVFLDENGSIQSTGFKYTYMYNSLVVLGNYTNNHAPPLYSCLLTTDCICMYTVEKGFIDATHSTIIIQN